MFVGLRGPVTGVALLHLVGFAITIAAFIVAMSHFPYTTCTGSDYKGCELLRAAIGMDGVLWCVPSSHPPLPVRALFGGSI